MRPRRYSGSPGVDNPFRSAYELWVALALFLCLLSVMFFQRMGAISQEIGLACFCFLLPAFGYKLYGGLYILYRRSLLSGRRVEFMPLSKAKQYFDKDRLWFGFGFEWEPQHTQLVHELSYDTPEKWMLPDWMHTLFLRSNKFMPKDALGKPYIHGLNETEEPIQEPIKIFEGGTAIIGTTQAGKGITLGIVVTQAIVRGDTVIVIDPKGSKRLQRNIFEACKEAGRGEPLVFHPRNKDKTTGVRLDPLATFDSAQQIASRLDEVLPRKKAGDPFRDYAASALETFAAALIRTEEKPTIKSLARHIKFGIDELLLKMLEDEAQKHARPDELQSAAEILAATVEAPPNPRLEQLILWFENFRTGCNSDLLIVECIKIYRHDKSHYAKITAALIPIFSLLTADALGELLSPDPTDHTDQRPILDMETVVDKELVLYMNLDSLSDHRIASAVGSLFLSDLTAVAGKRYYLGKTRKRIALFVDEVSNVLNQPLIELLNKGAEAGFSTTVVMQTSSDLSHRLGTNNATNIVLGNCNNIIALRCKDRETREKIAESFGKTYTAHLSMSLGSDSQFFNQTSEVPAFGGYGGRNLSFERTELIPPELLSDLANGEFIGYFGGARLYKGRVPILISDGVK